MAYDPAATPLTLISPLVCIAPGTADSCNISSAAILLGLVSTVRACMKSAAFFLFLLIVFNSAVADTPARVLTLGTNVSSAYTAERSQLVRGGSIEHIDCILQTIQQPY